jgi:fucose 4-O-acetylase-like acetyltransferase
MTTEVEVTAQKSTRNAVVDASKGLAILLVVLGHALQTHIPQFDDNWLFRAIYSFHMPMFFLLSGWVVKPDTKGRIRKTLLRLLLPAFCWQGISYFYFAGTAQAHNSKGYGSALVGFLENPGSGLWFLWVLALCIPALVLCRKFEQRIGILAYLIGTVILIALPIPFLDIPTMKLYFPFVVIGYLLSRSSVKARRLIPYLLGAAVAVWPLLLPFWRRTHELATDMPLFIGIAGHRVPTRMLEYSGLKLVEGCAGSSIAVFIAFLLFKYMHLTCLQWLGKHTLDIYVAHQLFVGLFPVSNPVAIAEAFTSALCLSILFSVVLRRVPLLDFLLYGGTLKDVKRKSILWASGASS